MKNPLTYVNIVLLALAVWLVAGTRAAWRNNHARYAAIAADPAPAPATPPPAESRVASRVDMAGYNDLLTRNLFAPDRNNIQPVLSTQKKPRPPLPTVIGTMNLSQGFMALMAERDAASRGAFRRVKVGEDIGGYKVLDIAEHQVVVEFDGQKVPIDVYESSASAAPPAANAPAASAAPQVISATAQPQAGAQTKPDEVLHSSRNPDPTITCVVDGNRKKCTRPWLMGPQVWYEDLQPAEKPR